MGKKLLVMTVGTGKDGSPADAIVFSIKDKNPDNVIFFVTKESKEITMPKVFQKLSSNHINNEMIICPNEYDIMECYRFFRNVLIQIVNQKKYLPSQIVIDYTTGTKAMSSALVLAGISANVGCLEYISGHRVNGMVVSGTERAISMRPVEIYWERIHQQAIEHFNAYRFDACIEFSNTMSDLSQEPSKIESSHFILSIAEAYKAWDMFNIKKAFEIIKKIDNEQVMKKYQCKGCFEYNKQFLYKEKENGEYSIEKAVDLFFNAKRRFDEGKYDDAVARLYRLIEYMAQVKLKKNHEIKTNEVDLLIIPEQVREKILKIIDGKSKIGLYDSYRLLESLDEPFGKYFMNEYNKENSDIKKYLGMRNNSILAHGFQPITKTETESIFDFAENLFKKFSEKKINDFEGAKFPKLQLMLNCED